jgi:hypothetical protein
MPLSRGSLYLYNYLWSHEFERREVSGRKARPACLVVRRAGQPAALFLFPLTTKQPPDDRVSLEIPETELRRANLKQKCWIVLDEYNRCEEDELYDFQSLNPIGSFGARFLGQVGAGVARASKLRRLRGVNR